jgi:hypothetical protein
MNGVRFAPNLFRLTAQLEAFLIGVFRDSRVRFISGVSAG